MSNQKLSERDVLPWLMHNAYVYQEGDEWHMSQVMKEGLDEAMKEHMNPGLPAVMEQKAQLPAKKEDWEAMYMQFIVDAGVPAKLEDSKMGVYYANKFSEAGLKAFKAAMIAGAQYQVLVASTKLYYKSSAKYKKAIGNYMSMGDWRTDYKIMFEAAQSGGIEAVKEHIKTETDEPTDRGHYRLG